MRPVSVRLDVILVRVSTRARSATRTDSTAHSIPRITTGATGREKMSFCPCWDRWTESAFAPIT